MRKIAVTGPESTGKSRLSKELSDYYHVPFVPEYARSYIEQLNRPYCREDLLEIARGQLEREKAGALRNPPLLISDTEWIVLKIWSLHKFGSCDPFILDQISHADYKLYLLCDVDLPWEADEQREHPHLRSYFFRWYQRELEQYGFRYVVIRGMGRQRLSAAIEAVDVLLNEAQ